MIARLCSYHTRPKAPIPTGCKSVYLGRVSDAPKVLMRVTIPASDLESGAEYLGPNEFRHLAEVQGCFQEAMAI